MVHDCCSWSRLLHSCASISRIPKKRREKVHCILACVALWWPTTVTAKPKTSRQNHKPHGKTKNLTAKPKTSRQNQKPQGKNKIPHGKTKNLTAKTKYLTAKPNTSQQKQNSFGFAVGICFCREVFGFCCEVFAFAVRSLVLPWGFAVLVSLPLSFVYIRLTRVTEKTEKSSSFYAPKPSKLYNYFSQGEKRRPEIRLRFAG